MTTISNIDLSNSTLQTNGYYLSDAITLTDEAFASVQVVKTAESEPNAKIKIIPLVSNDGTNFSAIRDNDNGFIVWEIGTEYDVLPLVRNISNIFALEPVRATSMKIMVLLGDCTAGTISLYVKTSMTES